MKRVLRVAVLGFAVAFTAGFTVGSADSAAPAPDSVVPPLCGELCGGAYIIVRGQCVCM
ncbi:hypothetical protein POL68_28050 [Stigmatella sp. ncwal1]|uniref:Uncharacterized protein n=1 Tax=Stigmatella ashevillensis TaxID=2995309 RepID=A0ABT5DGW6_9BACT|nr:hypothetical protein [Stigmatella ashevillena]MDC0712348.1 hypothetical protein [Stigmatella ashevillena]